MPTLECVHTGWTPLTAAGPDRATVQKLSVDPLFLVAAETDPGAGARVPPDAADALMLTGEYQVYSSEALAGTTLRIWARPVRDETVRVFATTVL